MNAEHWETSKTNFKGDMFLGCKKGVGCGDQRKKTPQRAVRAMKASQTTFLNQKNTFEKFLHEKGDMPRLSVLDNYRQINRIMTRNYLKKNAQQQQQQAPNAEEEENVKKMSDILMKLNSPKTRAASSKGGNRRSLAGSRRAGRMSKGNRSTQKSQGFY